MRRSTRLLASLASATCVTLAAPMAYAATLTVPDPQDTPDGVDVVAAKVAYEDRLRIVLRHEGMPDDATVLAMYWIDTEPGDRGPEYRVAVVANAGAPVLERVDRWNGKGTERRCPRLKAKADVFSDDPLVLRVPGACLGAPKKVRVAVKVRAKQPGTPVQVDWVPERRTFADWVRRH